MISITDIKATWDGAITLFFKRYVGPYRKRYKWLQNTQWYGKSELEQLQLELLKKMIKHAYQTVPYYNQLMQRLKIRPEDITQIRDIEKFPILKKSDLKIAGNNMVSNKFKSSCLRTVHTGGTTGLPVPIKRDLFSIGNEHAFVRRQFAWAGLGVRDRCAYLEGREVILPSSNKGRLYKYDAAMKELTLSTFHLSVETAPYYIEIMRKYKVVAMIGYPSAIYIIAKVCLERNISFPLRCVLTTSETIDDQRKQIISRAFNCRVFDFYGNAERVCYIHTCQHGSYHIIPEYGLTELLPAASPNEQFHRIVATGFWNMAMPLIRYDIGDLVEVHTGACLCGRNFPMVKRIIGRDGNAIVTPSGKVLGASAIECILARALYGMYDMPIVAGRVIQQAGDLVVLEYAPTSAFDNTHYEKLMQVFRNQVPSDMRIELRKIDSLQRTPRGKFVSFVMSEHH